MGRMGLHSDKKVPVPRKNLAFRECEIVPQGKKGAEAWKIFPTVVGKKKPGDGHQEHGSEPGEHQHETQNGKRTKLGRPTPREMNLHSEWGKEEERPTRWRLVPRGLKPERLGRRTCPDQTWEESTLPLQPQLSEKADFLSEAASPRREG